MVILLVLILKPHGCDITSGSIGICKGINEIRRRIAEAMGSLTPASGSCPCWFALEPRMLYSPALGEQSTPKKY